MKFEKIKPPAFKKPYPPIAEYFDTDLTEEERYEKQ